MNEEFAAPPVPKEFDDYSKALFKKDTISEREFVDLCLLAVKLVDDYWDDRQGLAYRMVGAWLKYGNIDKDDLLEEICINFGNLELPDHQSAGTEEQVRKEWQKLKQLVIEADKKFS